MEINITAEQGRALVKAASERVVTFQVGFIRLLGKNEDDDAQVAGSGTLVVSAQGD